MINVIGIGQNRENMTLGAIRAIEESDVIVGYKKYVAQISDLVSDKEIIKKGMGDENAHSFLSYLLNELPCCSLEYTTFVIGNQISVHCQRIA